MSHEPTPYTPTPRPAAPAAGEAGLPALLSDERLAEMRKVDAAPYNQPKPALLAAQDRRDLLAHVAALTARLTTVAADAGEARERAAAAGEILELMPGVFAPPTEVNGNSERQNIIAAERRRFLQWHASLCQALGFQPLDIREPGFGVPNADSPAPLPHRGTEEGEGVGNG